MRLALHLAALLLVVALAAKPPAIPELPYPNLKGSDVSEFITAERLLHTIHSAQEYIMDEQLEGDHWHFYPYLGTPYIGMYYIQLKALGMMDSSKIDVERLRKMIYDQQRWDGGWIFVPDINRIDSEPDATVYCYWTLKAMGEDIDSVPMLRARNFILQNGGIGQLPAMIRIWLSLFNNHDWNEFPYIPPSVYSKQKLTDIGNYFYLKDKVAQWVFPHVLPITYLRYNGVVMDLGPEYNLDELYVGKPIRPTPNKFNAKPRLNKVMVDEMWAGYQPSGTFGTYSVSSLYTLLALQHYDGLIQDEAFHAKFEAAKTKTQRFIEDFLYFHENAGGYLGMLDDGHYWDSILLLNALLESGYSKEKLAPAIDYLRVNAFDKTKELFGKPAVAYGLDFWNYPDCDDTGELLLTAMMADSHPDMVEEAIGWLLEMQNTDGGWGAFDRNRNPSILVKTFAGMFLDSAELFDAASVDVTCHVLEALVMSGHTLENSKPLRRAIEFLRREQEEDGSYWGRWSVNYIWGTSQAIPALKRAGVSAKDPMIARGIQWMLDHQNADGGWGESVLSYEGHPDYEDWIGHGVTGDSFTAWALMTLIEAAEDDEAAIQACHEAAARLIIQFDERGFFWDRSLTGTGHPGIVYMTYSVHAPAFGLIALTRYAERFHPELLAHH